MIILICKKISLNNTYFYFAGPQLALKRKFYTLFNLTRKETGNPALKKKYEKFYFFPSTRLKVTIFLVKEPVELSENETDLEIIFCY